MPAPEDFAEGEPPRRPKQRLGKRRQDARDDEDSEDLPVKKKSGNSGAVTAIGVAALVLGGQSLICGVCIGTVGALLGGAQLALKDQVGNDPDLAEVMQELGQIPTWLVVAEGVAQLIRGAGLIVGGIGTLGRRNWARYLLLGMAVFSVVIAIADTAATMALLGPGGAQDVTSSIFGVILALVFGVAAFIVLLSPDIAKEFTR